MKAGTKDKEQVRLQLLVDKKVCDRLDNLAMQLSVSRLDIAKWILEMGTSDYQYGVNKLAAWVAGKLRGVGTDKVGGPELGGQGVRA